MSLLAQDQEDKLVKKIQEELTGYQKKLVNEFVGSGEVESAITGNNSENSNALAEACKKWDIFITGGFKALRDYNKRVENTKKLQKEYDETLRKVISDFEVNLRALMLEFDNKTIQCVTDSELFLEVVTNDQIRNGKVLKI